MAAYLNRAGSGLTSAQPVPASSDTTAVFVWRKTSVDPLTPGTYRTIFTAGGARSEDFEVEPTDPADVTVTSAAELTTALASVGSGAIPAGSIIDLVPGFYDGNFVLPVHAGSSYVTFRSSGTLPAGRVAPSDLSELAVLRSIVNGDPPLKAALFSHGYRFVGIGFTQTAGNTYDLVRLGFGDGTQTSLDQVPYDFVFDRCYVYVSSGVEQRRGFGLNCGNTTIKRCYVENIKDADADSVAVGGWNGPGPYLIDDNFLESASENVIFGGSDPDIAGLIPSDITVTNNTLTKRIAWKGIRPVKNHFELKNAQHVRFANNVLSNCWASGQDGYSIVVTPRNQNGTAPWCTVEDVLIESNIITRVGGGFNISGTDDAHVSGETDGVTFRNNILVTDVALTDGQGWAFQITHSPNNVIIDNNTLLNEGTFLELGDKQGGTELAPGFKCRNNLAYFGGYGLITDGHVGTDGLNYYFAPGYVFTGNVLATDAGAPSDPFPATTEFPTVAAFQGEFVDYDGGDYTLVEGSPYTGKGATITADEGGGGGGDDDGPLSNYAWLGMSANAGPGLCFMELKNADDTLDIGNTYLTRLAFHRMVYRRTGTLQQVYADGALIATGTFDTSDDDYLESWLGYDGVPGVDVQGNQYYNFREWSAALTNAQIAAEFLSDVAVRRADLWRDTPLAVDGVDVSGNGRDWETVGDVVFAPRNDDAQLNATLFLMRRVRRFPHLSREQYRVFFHRLQIDMQVGLRRQATTEVLAFTPSVLLRWSDDGGRTWSNLHTESAGRIGQYSKRVLFNRLGYGRDRVFELSVSDPVAWRFFDAYVQLVAGVN